MNKHIILILFLSLSVIEAHGSDVLSYKEIKDTYEIIRNISLDATRVVRVDSLLLEKDESEFIFVSGDFYFFEPVDDRIIGAYFRGEGIFRLSTENEIEKQQIMRFSDKDTVELEFEDALLIFTDSTYEKIISGNDILSQYIDDDIIKDFINYRERARQRFLWNMDARVLSDLMTVEYGHFFQVYFDTPDRDHFLFIFDPFDQEEVSLIRYEKIKYSDRADFEIWYSAHARDTMARCGHQCDIKIIDIDVMIDSKKMLTATAQLEFVCLEDKVKFTPMKLAPVLRVESIIFGANDTCFFIQEDKKEDAQLWVLFPEELKKGNVYKLSLVYSGEGIIEDIGGDNFVVIGREFWFPSFYTYQRDPRRFKMKYAVPKKMTLLSTGKLINSWEEENSAVSEWDSEVEYIVAGFNYGKFSKVTQKSSLCTIDCYTNTKLSDDLSVICRILEENKDLQAELMMFPQELTIDRLGKNAAIESRNAYEVYVHFFGKIPFNSIIISQQPQTTFGQSWPRLIYLPFTAFFRESVRERLIGGVLGLIGDVLGLKRYKKFEEFHETLVSHEIAHQWWGHTLSIDSYHDEWLDEGFATYSAALYLQTTEGTKRFKDYMQILREQVLTKAEKDKRINDLGPVWLGDRLSSLNCPGGKRLIYAKGAYILHMLRMMLFDYDKKNDDRFISMMKDYVKTYSRKVVTTEDFKKVVERHFDKDMDWFFDQWVYGTEMPVYRFDYQIDLTDDGNYLLTVSAEQKGVSPLFKMPMHFVINFEDGHAVVDMLITGDEPIAKKFKLPQKPISVEANPWFGVLCEIKK